MKTYNFDMETEIRPLCRVVGCGRPRESCGWKKRKSLPLKRKYAGLCSFHNYQYKENGVAFSDLTPIPSPCRNLDDGGFEKGICVIDGCNRKQSSKGRRYGIKRYSRYCAKHSAMDKKGLDLDTPINKCTICGWDGPCDTHRIIPGKDGGKYVKGNVISICPNCHRLIHRGLLSLPCVCQGVA